MPKRKSPNALTEKEKAFVQEYLIDLNASQAAGRAGYKGKNLDVIGQKVKIKPVVALAIAEAMAKRQERVEIDQDAILYRLNDIGDLDPAECYSEKGQFLTIHDIPLHVRKCIRSIEVFEEFDGVGRDRTKIGEVVKVTFWDKIKSNELLGKHFGKWVDRLEIEDGSGRADRLARARQRAIEGRKGKK